MNFIAIDVETANADISSLCQIGCVIVVDGVFHQEWKSYIDPEDFFDNMNVSIHGIDEFVVKGAPNFIEIAGLLNQLVHEKIVICHTHFDRVAIVRACSRHGLPAPNCRWLDSARVVRRTWAEFSRSGYGLANVCETLGYEFTHHDALEDAKAAAYVMLAAIKKSGVSLDEWIARVQRPIEPGESNWTEPIKREGRREGLLYGERMVFTGTLSIPRREAADLAAYLGCHVDSSVSRRTTILVIGDQDAQRLAGHDKSTKQRKAESLIALGQRIRIIRESDFRELANFSD